MNKLQSLTYQYLGFVIAIAEWYEVMLIYTVYNKYIINSIFSNFGASKETYFMLAMAGLFIGKPIGAYFLGKYSDNNSRPKAATLSLLFLSSTYFASFLLHLLNPPFKAQLFFLIQFLKGCALGGNYSTSLNSIETAKYQYFSSSLINLGVFIGCMLADIIPKIFKNNILQIMIFSYASLIILISFLVFLTNSKNTILSSSFEIFKSLLIAILIIYIGSHPTMIGIISLYFIVQLMNLEFEIINDKNIAFGILLSLTPIIFSKFCVALFTLEMQIIILVLIIGIYSQYLKFKTEKQSDKNFSQRNEEDEIQIKDLINSIRFVALDIIPFYFLFILIPFCRNLNNEVTLIDVSYITKLVMIFTPIIGMSVEFFKNPKFLLNICAVMITATPVVINLVETTYPVYAMIYYAIMMSLCYGILYAYLPLKFKQNIRARVTGISLNIASSTTTLIFPIIFNNINNGVLIVNCIFLATGLSALQLINKNEK